LLMAAEDWRGEEERNTLGMAGYWLEKLGDDTALASESQREAAGKADEKPDGQAENKALSKLCKVSPDEMDKGTI